MTNNLKEIAGYLFFNIPLVFEGGKTANVFANKNNKTVAETLKTKPYLTLSANNRILRCSIEDLDRPLGKFLMDLKCANDDFYLSFLNKYGDLQYTRFSIADAQFHNLKGVYAYYVRNELKYIGRCTGNMKLRINDGYGRITPKNCYKDGQTTNCHVNSKIAQEDGTVSLWLHEMDDKSEIYFKEKELIKLLSPDWNIKK